MGFYEPLYGVFMGGCSGGGLRDHCFPRYAGVLWGLGGLLGGLEVGRRLSVGFVEGSWGVLGTFVGSLWDAVVMVGTKSFKINVFQGTWGSWGGFCGVWMWSGGSQWDFVNRYGAL